MITASDSDGIFKHFFPFLKLLMRVNFVQLLCAARWRPKCSLTTEYHSFRGQWGLTSQAAAKKQQKEVKLCASIDDCYSFLMKNNFPCQHIHLPCPLTVEKKKHTVESELEQTSKIVSNNSNANLFNDQYYSLIKTVAVICHGFLSWGGKSKTKCSENIIWA